MNIGVDANMDMYQKKETRLLNLFSVIVFMSVIACLISFIFIKGDYPITIELLLVFYSLLVPYLNYKKSIMFQSLPLLV